MFKEIAAKDIQGNPFRMIADEWMLAAVGNREKYNMMTASWGFFGEMWNRQTAVTVIRPVRYTYELMENNDYFSLSFYGDNRKIHDVCGSKSGRNVDKAKEAGLTPVFSDNTVYFEEARLVLICKKIYAGVVDPLLFLEPAIDKLYPKKDYHKAYVGEIIKTLIKDGYDK